LQKQEGFEIGDNSIFAHRFENIRGGATNLKLGEGGVVNALEGVGGRQYSKNTEIGKRWGCMTTPPLLRPWDKWSLL